MEDKIYKYLWKMSLYISKNKLTLTDEKDNLTVMDQWIIAKCKETIKRYLNNIKDDDLDKAKEILDNFFIDDFYNIYKIISDYQVKENHDYENSNVLLNVYLEILKMYMLFIPDVVKFLYCNLYSNTSILLYEDNLKEYEKNDKVLSFGEDIKNIIKDVNKFRVDANISKRKIIDSVILNIKRDDIKLFSKSLNDILKLLNVKNLNVEFSDKTSVDLIANDKIYIKKR